MSHIHKTTVSQQGLTAMIRRLGRDCRPLQFVREYVQNGIEAIERTGKPGKILVDVNWDYIDFGITQTFKLSFTDTGDGMTGEEIGEYINKLSSTGGENIYENYGMGAKIASITRNPIGIVYESWKNGEGSQALFKYDETEDAFGLEQFEQTTGQFGYFQPLHEDAMPELIRDAESQHGTRVTLLGENDLHDTMALPDGAQGARETWLYQYINSRYFDIPEGIEIKVRIAHDKPRENSKHNFTRIIRGQKFVLDKLAVKNGTVELSDANVHWWILKKGRKSHGREVINGHTACLNQAEIFDRTDGRSNRAVLFGIIFGARDVVLYIEPNDCYVQNTTRTGLINKNGSELPWEKWADEFRELMPQALDAHVKAIMNDTVSDSHEKSIRERLQKLRKFYKISRYRKAANGDFEINEDTVFEGMTGADRQGNHAGLRSGPRSGTNPGNVMQLLTVLKKDSGVNGEYACPDPFPRLDWVSAKNGTREEGELEDRAATFIERDNRIKANKDFQGFGDVIEHFIDQFKHIPDSAGIVADQVYEQFEQQLIECVAGATSLKGRKLWLQGDYESAISDEALTVAVMSRYHLMREINRALRSKLGKPEELSLISV